MIPGLHSDKHSPNGWRLEKTEREREREHHQFAANRLKNILIALENLLVQMGADPEQSNLAIKLGAAKEVYETEMMWHAQQAGLYANSRRNSE